MPASFISTPHGMLTPVRIGLTKCIDGSRNS